MVSADLKYENNPDRFDGVAWAMQESWGGVFIAGVAFSLFYLIGLVSYGIFAGMMGIGSVLFALVLIVVFPMVGLLLTMFWSIFSFAFVLIVNLSLGGMLNRRTAVAVIGGATGFLATYWQIFDWANVGKGAWILCLVGVGFAVLICQAGALGWAHRRNVFYQPSAAEMGSAPRYQFGIKQMLAMTVLFGLLFAANRMVPNHEVLVMAGFYAGFQLLGLALDRAQLFLRTGSVIVAG